MRQDLGIRRCRAGAELFAIGTFDAVKCCFPYLAFKLAGRWPALALQ